MPEVPADLASWLDGRDKEPLGEGGLVRLQSIGLGPGIESNFRVVVMEDGRCFVARNAVDSSRREGVVFNVPVPDSPTFTLPAEALDQVRTALDEVGFFAQEPYVEGEPAKDGSLSIVTARRDGREHEVWYMRTGNALTDLLHEIAEAAGEDSTWADLLEEQLALQRKREER